MSWQHAAMAAESTVIALPGFTRRPVHLHRLAEAVASSGRRCVRPHLAPRLIPTLYMSRSHLDRLAVRLSASTGPGPIIIAGHSAGGAAGTYLASTLCARGADVRGVVLIDGVDSPNHLIAKTLPALDDLRIAAVLAPPSPCNRDGALERYLRAFPRVRVTMVDGAGHGDIEGSGVGLYRRVCKDTSDPLTADRVLADVMAAIAWVEGGADVDHSHH